MQGNGKGIPTPTATCIDAETLAAWADGGLPKIEAAAVEAHLADCERCTAIVATLARTIPETPAAGSLWQRWRLQWLVPIATAATVAALWVLVPRREPLPPATLDSTPATETQGQVSTQPSPPVRSQPTPALETRAQEDRLQSKVIDRLVRREEAQSFVGDRQAEGGTTRAEPGALNQTIAPASPTAREAARADAKTGDAQVTGPLAASAPPRAPAAAPAPTAAVEASRAAAPRAAQPQGRSVAEFAAIAPQLVVTSPDPMTRWRIIGTDQIERTTTGGTRWEPAVLPERATLTAGSAPAPSICWLVGRTGAIYVTTDGLRFTRVPFPDRTDFASIQAIDGRRATVVTIDGRTLRTEDQGATWSRDNP